MTAHVPAAAELQERLEAWAERYRVPGVARGVLHGDDVTVAATGVTNIETGVGVTPETLFQIGSITKLYTTTLIMQLVDEGRIELDAPAKQYLPDLCFGDGAATITIRHLLTHTSGVDGDYFEDHGRGDDCVERYVTACAKLDQLFAPGAMWSYCNAGFVVLGRIIETMTGVTWDAALRARIVEPLGMAHTVTLPEEALLFTTVVGHIVTPTLEVKVARPWNMARSCGPAGSSPCSTVGDMLAFAKMHIDGGVASDGTRLLSERSVRTMQEPHAALPAGTEVFASHWGLGWMLFDWGGRRVIGHDGGTIGQASSLRILPEERFAVVSLTDSIGGAMLNPRAMHWLFGEVLGLEMPPRAKPPESPPAIDLRPYEGVYLRLGFEYTVRQRNGELWIETKSGAPVAENDVQTPPAQMFAVSESLFLQRDPWGTFRPVIFSDFVEGKPRYLFNNRVARRAEEAAP